MKNYLDKLPQVVFNKTILYNSHPIADLFKKECLDDFEDDPRFGTFYTYTQWISQYKKEEKEEREQREREYKYNTD